MCVCVVSVANEGCGWWDSALTENPFIILKFNLIKNFPRKKGGIKTI